MIIKNNTHYFSEYSKLYNCFPDPDSFEFLSGKRMGYFQRLWFEYAYTRKVRGSCFFYTLTYNDKSIPKFLGRNCFSYDDVRYITNGKLSKVLKRQYGSRLKYFCACEKGSGKGSRGLGNNPHYHFIFFVQPLHDDNEVPIFDTYIPISPQQFKDIIYELWQGASSDRFVPWQYAKFGHCQEGKYNGEVLGAEPFQYVGKYVTKDDEDKCYEQDLEKVFYNEVISEDISNRVIYCYYQYLCSTDLAYILLKDDHSRKELFFDYLHLREYNRWRKCTGYVDRSLERYYIDVVPAYQIVHHSITSWFYDIYVPQYISERISEYKNKYSGKCRMSKSLGLYGINFIMEVDGNPTIVLNTSKGYQPQYPCLYYIRKKYYDVKLCPITGNPLYYLNEDGMRMKLASIKHRLDCLYNTVIESISYYHENDLSISLNDSFKEHGYLLDAIVNGDPIPEFKSDNSLLTELESRSDFDMILHRYCVWHFIYQYRHFSDQFDIKLDFDCLEKDYLSDYAFFLRQNSYYLDYESGTIFDLVYKTVPISFSNHPAFQSFVKYFELLDFLVNDVSDRTSEIKKRRFAETSSHLSALNSYKFNCSLL